MSLPKGFYKGRAIKGSEQYGVSKNGNDQIVIDLDLGELGQASTFLNFSDAAAPYAIERLRACGWKGDDVTDLTGIDANEIDVQVKYETYQGKEQMKVEIATGGGKVKLENQMDDRSKRAFGARMKQFLKGNGAATPKPASKPQETPDDLPF